MVSVFDVAKYMLEKQGALTTIKLQKLVYYAQAWSLVWDEKALFPESIEAWKLGPVVPALYQKHKGTYEVTAANFPEGDSTKLTATQRETIDEVLKAYGDKPAQWLVDLSHSEDPWKKARKGVPDWMGFDGEISIADIAEYYSSL